MPAPVCPPPKEVIKYVDREVFIRVEVPVDREVQVEKIVEKVVEVPVEVSQRRPNRRPSLHVPAVRAFMVCGALSRGAGGGD